MCTPYGELHIGITHTWIWMRSVDVLVECFLLVAFYDCGPCPVPYTTKQAFQRPYSNPRNHTEMWPLKLSSHMHTQSGGLYNETVRTRKRNVFGELEQTFQVSSELLLSTTNNHVQQQPNYSLKHSANIVFACSLQSVNKDSNSTQERSGSPLTKRECFPLWSCFYAVIQDTNANTSQYKQTDSSVNYFIYT